MSSVASDKHRRFVELLYQRTLNRGVAWEINTQFQVFLNIAGGTLFVLEGINPQGEDSIFFKIFGADGQITDSFSDDDLRTSGQVPNGFGNWYLLCDALYEMAKRQATGADNVLDAMIAELDDGLPF